VFNATATVERHDDQGSHSGLPLSRRSLIPTVAVCLGAVVTLQLMLWILTSPAGATEPAKTLIASVIGFILSAAIVAVGFLYLRDKRQLEVHEQTIAAQKRRAAATLDTFAAEELRVRREVADGLHGTVQHNLVMISVRLTALATTIAEHPSSVGHNELAELNDIRADIDSIREHDVRTMSQLLYPVGIDIGAIAAIRLLIQRLPASIAGKIVVSDEIVELEGFGRTSLSIERRLMIVRIVEEALTNALRHGNATSVAVALGLSGTDIIVQFDDDGSGLSEILSFRGIARLRERLETVGGSIELANNSPLGGVRLTARIPQ
jgi:two-component system sensor histidine kinase UhpB